MGKGGCGGVRECITGELWLDDFALIFVPYGHCDGIKILRCAKPYSVSKALTADRQTVIIEKPGFSRKTIN
jgi:hypothetical protein